MANTFSKICYAIVYTPNGRLYAGDSFNKFNGLYEDSWCDDIKEAFLFETQAEAEHDMKVINAPYLAVKPVECRVAIEPLHLVTD